MALEVIGAGLGRNATLSLKFAFELLGLGPCHHMTEVFADARRQIPLWLDAARGEPDWDAIFEGFRSTCDYPSASYWREIADHYPDAPVVLVTRDPDRWFDSVNETIFSPWMQDAHAGTPEHELMRQTIFAHIDGDVTDREFLTDWYLRRNAEVISSLPAERLLHFDPRLGWEPLCAFLGLSAPDIPFPKVNTREQLGTGPRGKGTVLADPEMRERSARMYIELMRQRYLQVE